MAEFNGSLFNDGLFDGNYVLGSGAALGAASVACGGTGIKTTECAAIASANVVMRAGRTSACTAATLVGFAVGRCQPARVRNFSAAVIAGAAAASDGLRIRTSAAPVVGAAQGVPRDRRLRTSRVQASGIAVLCGAIQKLAFPPLAEGLRVRRWSKPARVLDLLGKQKS
jgi:hypothetical protein